MTDASALTIRAARRDDVAAIVAMLADDRLGRARERIEEPLPQCYSEAFDRIVRDANLQLVVAEEAGSDAQRFYERLGFARSHVGMVMRF